MKILQNIILIFASFFAGILMYSCSAGKVSVDETYSQIRPAKQLELPDQVTDNLIVTISNVADETSSYKNYVQLYINDKLVTPNWLVSNVQSDWIYKLRLRPGYYQVKAVYTAVVGWDEESYDIVSEEMIRITHDQRTKVNATIVKQPNGTPVNKTMYFKQATEPLDEPATSSEVSTAPATKPQILPESKKQTILLQINTIPEHAQVIVNDQTVGQSPVRHSVDRSQDHIVQVSAPDYKTAIKFVDHSMFKTKDVFHIIQELEKE